MIDPIERAFVAPCFLPTAGLELFVSGDVSDEGGSYAVLVATGTFDSFLVGFSDDDVGGTGSIWTVKVALSRTRQSIDEPIRGSADTASFFEALLTFITSDPKDRSRVAREAFRLDDNAGIATFSSAATERIVNRPVATCFCGGAIENFKFQ